MSDVASVLGELDPDVREALIETGALRTGHFALTSGRHSAIYFQAMQLLQHPHRADVAAKAVADSLGDIPIDVTLAPAVGGIVWGHAVARPFRACRAVFAERVDGAMTLRRSFALEPGMSVLLAEDVVTTGGTVLELKGIAERAGAKVVGLAALLDRSGGRSAPGVPVHAWASLAVESWSPDECPLCAEGSAAVSPGSRGLR